MEPVGFAVGIAGLASLFSICLDVIDKVDSYKEFGVEARAAISKFEADKYLFTKWAQDVGIDKHNKRRNKHLDNPETVLIVQNILSSIQEIFSKSKSTISKLKHVVDAGPSSFPEGILHLKERKKSQNADGAISRRVRLGWSLWGQQKFDSQVRQFGDLVNRLYRLVPPNGLTGPLNLHNSTIGIDSSSRNEEIIKELDIWLGASWTSNVYDNLIRRRLDGTCDWILSRPEFLDWISSEFPAGTAKILWINGPAGYGKTILCGRVVQHLTTVLRSPPAYYFCSSDYENRRDPLTVMRSWISQIISCNADAFEFACIRYDAKVGRNASLTDIIELFKTIVQHTPNCTFVVDGLDECAWAEEKWKSNYDDSPKGFFESIKQAVAHTITRILILSRDEPEIRYELTAVFACDSNQGLSQFKICPDDVRSDAMLFSRSIVDKKLANKSEILRQELSKRMADRSEGMFLWVKMLEEDLGSWKSEKKLNETIDQAPTALNHLYDRNWKKISRLSDKYNLRALSILRWTAFALRPLTILEITEALLVDDDNCEDLLVDELPDNIDEDYISNEILGPCGSFLETQKAAPEQDLGSMTIHLAHFSVKQYIICHMPAEGGLRMAKERLRASSEAFQSNILAKACLRYLNFCGVWQESHQSESGLFKCLFRHYAAGSWYHHPRSSGSNYVEVVELTNAFFSSNNRNWESWKKWFDANDDKSKMPESQREVTSTNRLFYASFLGLRETVIYLLEKEKLGVNDVDEFNRTALQAAALKGQILILKMLLEKGANVTIQNIEGWTPLNLASYSGHVDVVKFLLDNGADVTAASKKGWTPVNSASHNGHIDIVNLLLKKGADKEVASNEGWKPLSSASDSGHVDVVRLLLEKGADMRVACNGWTLLYLASHRGHIKIVELLLEKGANMTAVNYHGWTPLHPASDNGHVEVVKLLLDKGADVTIGSKTGWTPLILAADSGHADIVKVLLDKGADKEVASNEGWTPLSSAADSGHVDVVELLLERGAELESKNKLSKTPLLCALESGNETVINLLLKKGAKLETKDEKGQTPLLYAVEKGNETIINLLLKKGAKLETRNERGQTPLFCAVEKGNETVINLLLETGAELEAKNRYSQTPLSCAAASGNETVINLLLEKGAKLETKDERGHTPLLYATVSGHELVVKQLLAQGAELEAKNIRGQTPMLIAAKNGHEAVVKLLIGQGAELESKDSMDRTPLWWAARYGTKSVELLLATDRVDVDSKDRYNSTPLSIAARIGHKDVVAFLLTKSHGVNVRDSFDRSPLWWARSSGHPDIADLLLEKYRENGINVREDESPTTKISVLKNKSSQICDICILSISDEDNYYHCGVCNNGDFDICTECFAMNGHCLDQSHTLIWEINRESD